MLLENGMPPLLVKSQEPEEPKSPHYIGGERDSFRLTSFAAETQTPSHTLSPSFQNLWKHAPMACFHSLTLLYLILKFIYLADAVATNSNYFWNIYPHSNITHKADSFISKNIYKGKTAAYSWNVS